MIATVRLPVVKAIRVKGEFREQDHPRADDGKFGSGGGGGGTKPDHVASWAGHAKKLPAKVLDKARTYVKTKYAKLESRYGRKMAIAIMAAGVAGLPLPVPGSSLLTAAPIIAVAELHRWYSSKELSDADVERIGKAWMRELLDGWVPPIVVDDDDVRIDVR